MFGFLETDIGEQKKYEKRIQISVDNTVNDLHHEIRSKNRVKDKNDFFYWGKHGFFKTKIYFVLGDIFF